MFCHSSHDVSLRCKQQCKENQCYLWVKPLKCIMPHIIDVSVCSSRRASIEDGSLFSIRILLSCNEYFSRKRRHWDEADKERFGAYRKVKWGKKRWTKPRRSACMWLQSEQVLAKLFAFARPFTFHLHCLRLLKVSPDVLKLQVGLVADRSAFALQFCAVCQFSGPLSNPH